MTVILVATPSGCHLFTEDGDETTELSGRPVYAIAPDGAGHIAVVDEQEIWRRDADGTWSAFADAGVPIELILSVDGTVYAGAMGEAAVFRIGPGAEAERLSGFDATPGRSDWFAGGPPLSLRSLTATADGTTLLAVPHVGGIPRSTDGGETWTPTVPVQYDVHEVRAHPSRSEIVAAAAEAGLCTSNDGGHTWTVRSEGLEQTTSLAVAVLDDEVLFSVQDSPFATRSQVWRWQIGSERIEPVRDGLPEWLDGKVDTAHISAGGGRAAIVDGGGSLWLSAAGSRGWERIASVLGYVYGVVLA